MQTVGLTFQVSRAGLVTWQVPYHFRTFAEISVPPSYQGAGLSSLQGKQTEDGEFDAMATYEGASAMLGLTAAYTWEESWSNRPLDEHPRLQSLLDQYGGRIDAEAKTIIWPPTIGGSSQGGVQGSGGVWGSDTKQERPNPMFGIEDFMSPGGIWTETKVHAEIPPTIFNAIGRVKSFVPGGFPTPADRDWLTLPPTLRQAGNVWELGSRWMLSFEGGWNKALYQGII